MVHLQLLSTPPRGDAVTFGFRPESVCLGRTCTSLIEYTLRRTGTGFQPVILFLIGVGKTGCPVSPPSEPYVRFSRIRLSGRWFTTPWMDGTEHGLLAG